MQYPGIRRQRGSATTPGMAGMADGEILAALEAGRAHFRPVLMTALAKILGMLVNRAYPVGREVGL